MDNNLAAGTKKVNRPVIVLPSVPTPDEDQVVGDQVLTPEEEYEALQLQIRQAEARSKELTGVVDNARQLKALETVQVLTAQVDQTAADLDQVAEIHISTVEERNKAAAALAEMLGAEGGKLKPMAVKSLLALLAERDEMIRLMEEEITSLQNQKTAPEPEPEPKIEPTLPEPPAPDDPTAETPDQKIARLEGELAAATKRANDAEIDARTATTRATTAETNLKVAEANNTREYNRIVAAANQEIETTQKKLDVANFNAGKYQNLKAMITDVLAPAAKKRDLHGVADFLVNAQAVINTKPEVPAQEEPNQP